MKEVEEARRLATIIANCRIEAGISQEYMSLALGVSKNTISNWEKGTSTPSFRQLLKWYNTLNMNPIPYLMRYVYPDAFSGSGNIDNQREALHHLIDSMPDDIIRQLHFILMGTHGSSIFSIIQMVVAHLHTDMRTRVIVARTIKENYEMCEKRGELICSDEAAPDLELLEESIQAGKEAAGNRQHGYTIEK